MNFIKLILSISVCFLPGIAGGFITAKNLHPWYDNLIKPSFNPPSWIFSPVWTMLYFLMGISLFLVVKGAASHDKRQGLIFFTIQLLLNGLWSIVFFGMHSISGALIVILLLLAFIILSGVKFYKVSKASAYLLIPYLLWVSFATALNFSLYKLN